MRDSRVLLTVGLAAFTATLVPLAARVFAGGQTAADPAAAPPRALLIAEDGRAATRDEAAPILAALGNPEARIVRRAVLALGRLENPIFIPDIRRVVGDSDASVRTEAIHALSHAAGDDPAIVLPVLRERLAQERVPQVRGVILETLGRLAYKTPDERSAVEPLLVEPLTGEVTPVEECLGAAEGLENLIRGARNTAYTPSAAALQALRRSVHPSGRPALGPEFARLRRLALSALTIAGAVDDLFARAVLDRDEQVRRLAIAGLGRDGVAPELRAAIVARGLADESPMVRYEALRLHGRSMAGEDCAEELTALGDPGIHVALLAIDLLGNACPKNLEATNALSAILTGFVERDAGPSAGTWHRAARAVVSLARRDEELGRKRVAELATHPVWEIRMAAARAAAIVRDGATLSTLADDMDDNVREAAIEGLARVMGHEADTTILATLRRPAYQVVIAAARALAGTPDRERAVPVLLTTLAALTSERRDTSRDARAGLLTRIEELGGPANAEALRPYLSDPDPEIAAIAARLLSSWTGAEEKPVTTRVVPLPVPPQAELDRLPSGMRVTMTGGRRFEVAFDTWDATMTVVRVARLVRQGYYNGLTFHRVVPNFVIQGGSPGANEYVGDGPFMRDECGLRSNLRYSIGISTRGRDTGDAQFYINLVDNERLDHHYPVFGEVTSGLDVIDGIVDGDVIARIDLLPVDDSRAGAATERGRK